MKLAALLSFFLIGWSFAVLPDHLGYDQTTTSPWYQTCAVGQTGTACVAFNPQSGNAQFYIASSLQAPGATYAVSYTNGAGASVVSGSAPLSAPYAPITGSIPLAAPVAAGQGVPRSLTLFVGASTDTFTFSNVYIYETKNGQSGIRDLIEDNSNKDGSGYKFAPTYVESFTPSGSNVLLSRLPSSKNLLTASSGNVFVVVATGSGATIVSENDLVQVNVATCLRKLVKLNANPANTDDVLALSPYCVVPQSAILGKVMEGSYGANRASQFTGHIRKALGSSWTITK